MTHDPSIPLIELLTPDEMKLLGYPGDNWENGHVWWEVEDFRSNAWDLYGSDWPAHVPSPRECPLNGAMMYLFGEVLWHYQLQTVYCPVREIQTIGARGTGKTVMFAMIGGMYTAMKPGNNWLHAAPSKDQADKAYDYLLTKGAHGLHPGRSFVDLFITRKRKAPFAELEFRPWDKWDDGSKAMFRSTGKPNEPGELLRSTEVGLLTIDEAFRTFLSEWAILVLAGCLRGLNEWRANQAPALKRQWQELSMDLTMCDDPVERDRLEIAKDKFTYDNGLAKDTLQWIGGNAGWYRWPYRKQEKAEKDGFRRVYAVTWLTSWNPAFTRAQREEVIRKYGNQPDVLAMELEGKRPPPPGDIYVEEQLDLLFDPVMDAQVIEAVNQDRDGYVWTNHDDYGVVRYAIPPEPGRIYAGGADGGTKTVPSRGKWVIMLADITDDPPFPIVYFEMGNVTHKGSGSIMPWLTRLRELTTDGEGMLYYPMMHSSLYADATGLQRWVHEVADTWMQPVQVHPFDMTSKPGLILKSQLLLSKGIFRSCTVQQWEHELGIYELPDNKPMQQDIVMAFLALCAAVWEFKGEGLGLYFDKEMEDRAKEEADFRKWRATLGATRLLTAQRETRHSRNR